MEPKKRGWILVLLVLFLVFSLIVFPAGADEQIVCGTADGCPFMTRDECSAAGGEEVIDELYDAMCTAKCCKFSTGEFCRSVPTYFACKEIAAQYGVDFSSVSFEDPDDTGNCGCGEPSLTGSLKIIIKNEAGSKIDVSEIILEGGPLSSRVSSGEYLFEDLSPGPYTLIVSAPAPYLSKRAGVEIAGEVQQEKTIVLQEGEGSFAIMVSINEVLDGGSTQPLEGATISWRGPLSDSDSGIPSTYQIDELTEGEYTVVVSKEGFASEEQKIAISANTELSFNLEPVEVQTISGRLFIDLNENGDKDSSEEYLPGAPVFLDNSRVGRSQRDGYYEISTQITPGTHVLKSTHEGARYVGQVSITIVGDESIVKNIPLVQVVGDCEPGAEKAPESFTFARTLGDKVITLNWQNPCGEVLGYTLFRKDIVTGDERIIGHPSPIDTDFIDDEVEWEHSYSYTLVPVYENLFDAFSLKAEIPPIFVGNAECEGRYSEENNKWEKFCLPDLDETTEDEGLVTWSCKNDNTLYVVKNCVATEHCAPGEGGATCKEENACTDFGGPFGLFYSKNACYGVDEDYDLESGEEALNYCYYDYTKSIQDTCHSCNSISSCFNYQSRDACELNSCFSEKCVWINAGESESDLVDYDRFLDELDYSTNDLEVIGEETGAGFCVQEGYEGYNTCNLCGPESMEIFENYFCTADICSGLGRCFSNDRLTDCYTCGDYPSNGANCEKYVTELECNNGVDVGNANGIYSYSEDTCDWGRCAWDRTNCFKDGNADTVNDCQEFSPSVQSECRKDISPPMTTLVATELPVISTFYSNLTFRGDDESIHSDPSGAQASPLGSLFYCIQEIGINAPSVCSIYHEAAWEDSFTSEITVPILDKIDQEINGEIYNVLFFSEDKYFNREDLQKVFVLVDNVNPTFTIKDEYFTEGDTTHLTVWLEELDEQAWCTFSLTELGASEPFSVQEKGFGDFNKQVGFGPLVDWVWATLGVSCEDRYGNIYEEEKSYTFDLDERIEIISPKDFISTTKPTFAIQTTVNSVCKLVETATSELVGEFVSDDNKFHSITPERVFPPGEYFAEYKAVCQELANIDETFEGHFHFEVDITPPETKITIREGDRVVSPIGQFWEFSFVELAEVTLSCEGSGFACGDSFYCIGDEFTCPPSPPLGYSPYTGPLLIEETSRICYYSKDVADNKVYSADCGIIDMAGMGVTFEDPEAYIYETEKWIVSSEPAFDWRFSTKVPTEECRLGFTPEFSYFDQPDHQVLAPDPDGKYHVLNFPNNVFKEFPEDGGIIDVYIQCLDLSGEIGPEQLVHLEYDPYAPTILESYADPDVVYEGKKTSLFVNTDAKTQCRYSDDSEGQGSFDFETMKHSFPGFDENILYLEHQDTYTVNNFVSDSGVKDYVLNTQCRNGAGTLSDVEQVTFTVDYVTSGHLKSVFPEDGMSFASTTVELSVITSKTAFCKYKINETYQDFIGTGGTTHQATLTSLTEGVYQIPFICDFGGGHSMEQDFNFEIDFSGPVITLVDDGNNSCGADEVKVKVYTDETDIATYSYQLFDLGEVTYVNVGSNTTSLTNRNTSGSANTNLAKLIDEKTVNASDGIILSSDYLEEGKSYAVRVKAIDSVDNIGTSLTSDGFNVLSLNSSYCQDTSDPEVIVVANSTCLDVNVELYCNDETTCDLSYGKHFSDEGCNITKDYLGEKIVFSKSGWICYYAEDALGNSVSNEERIDFIDADGDYVSDSCDLCPTTPNGKVVNDFGCAYGEVPLNASDPNSDPRNPWTLQGGDSDDDTLPDQWEFTYDALSCPFDSNNPDTDGDGISDALNDYDGDSYTNYEEYISNTDPCSALDVPIKKKGGDDGKDGKSSPPIPPPKSETNILALIFLVMGLLMMFGGVGYLVYYYKYSPSAKKTGPTKQQVSLIHPAVSRPKGKTTPDWQKKLVELRKAHEEKLQERKRESIFGTFGKKSSSIPPLERFLKKKGSSEKKLRGLAKHYSEHKKEIKPSLRPEERSVFDKLEGLAKKSGGKDVGGLLKKKENKDLFSQLKQISKKRKKNG